MRPPDALERGAHVMTVCNACRYCEQYCPVFPAMEERLTFGRDDLTYLANLCHNCGECLYACQYAPPHEFGINVPRTLAEIRGLSYDAYRWPAACGRVFGHNGVAAGLALAAGFTIVIFLATWVLNPDALFRLEGRGEFYAVVPHAVLVALFGGVFLFVLLALGVATTRLYRDINRVHGGPVGTVDLLRGMRDALTLRHLHVSGEDCTVVEESRTPWRRWFHHCTFYGFALSFASTSVAAVYHIVFGWHAPYPYLSLPVILGTAGGLGLIVGPVGLALQRSRRDPALGDPQQDGLDRSFIALLLMTSITGLLLLALREGPLMASLLIVHLGVVLALFVTLPYGKFVHGLFRTAALVKYAVETRGARG